MIALKTIKGWISDFQKQPEPPVVEPARTTLLKPQNRKQRIAPYHKKARPYARKPHDIRKGSSRYLVCNEIAKYPYGVKYENLWAGVKANIECEQLDCLLRSLRRNGIIELKDNFFVISFGRAKKYAR